MSITVGLQRALTMTPTSVATICGSRTRTFTDQAARVACIAAGLRSIGLEDSDRVAILAPNSDDYVELLYAISWAGLVFQPVNTRWTTAEVVYALNDSSASALLVAEEFAEFVPRLRDEVSSLQHVLFVGDEKRAPSGMATIEGLVSSAAPMDDVRMSDRSPAGIFYTGGTTGRPKGVVLSHGNLLSSALGTLAGEEFLTPRGRVLHVAPLFHLAGIWPWLAQSLLGGSHVILPAFEPGVMLDTMDEHEVTDVMLVPTMIQFFVGHLEEVGTSPETLRRVIYAGSSIPQELIGRAQKALPGVGFLQAYGQTELAPAATLLYPDEHEGDHLRSAGRAAPHTEVRVVGENDEPLPADTVGEIVVNGPQVMLEYWGQPEATAAALRGGWMHTGDAGYMDEQGYLYVVDRLKDMIITGGENVYSAEVENALASMPGVLSCAVIGVPDERWGERVHAVIAVGQGVAPPDLDVVQEHCRELIANYKVPRSVEVVSEMPLSAAGKVLKRELRRTHEAAQP